MYLETAVRTYWSLSLAWRRGIGAENWTYGDILDALADLTVYRGYLPIVANDLSDDIVRDKRSHGILFEDTVRHMHMRKPPSVMTHNLGPLSAAAN